MGLCNSTEAAPPPVAAPAPASTKGTKAKAKAKTGTKPVSTCTTYLTYSFIVWLFDSIEIFF